MKLKNNDGIQEYKIYKIKRDRIIGIVFCMAFSILLLILGLVLYFHAITALPENLSKMLGIIFLIAIVLPLDFLFYVLYYSHKKIQKIHEYS